MEDIRGFSERGNWYKGNLHSHTTNSDGHLTPAESVRMFREHGYSFLAFTDHDRYSDYRTDFDGGDFIIIPGYEASAVLYKDFGLKKRLKVHHVNALLGTSRMVREAREPLPEHLEFLPQRVYFKEWNGAAVLRDMVERMRGMGFIAMYNHPVWSRVSEYEFAGEAGIFALEIFNYDTENESGTGFDTTHWDVMLRAGRRVWGAATDDNHNEGIFDDSCGGWVTVRAPELTHDAIIENLLAGNFYSSAGPEIYDWGSARRPRLRRMLARQPHKLHRGRRSRRRHDRHGQPLRRRTHLRRIQTQRPRDLRPRRMHRHIRQKGLDEPDIPEMSRGGAELRKPAPLFHKRLARRYASAAQGRLPNPPFISSQREARRKIRRASRCASAAEISSRAVIS